jgi:hypothetical protein
MFLFVVYILPPIRQFWTDGSPVLWSATVEAASEMQARKIIRKSKDLGGMPIVNVFRN